MHILIIHQAFASLDEPGGTRHYEFARLIVSRGHEVTVIASPVSYITGAPSQPPPFSAKIGEVPKAEGVRVIRARVYEAHHKSFFHRVMAFFSFMFSSFFIGLKVKHVDLVWGTSPPIFQGVTAWALAKIKRVPFLFEVRDLWPQFAIAVGVLKNPLLIRASEWLERFLYRGADRVMVNSPGFLESVQSRGAKRTELIPNGADPSMFDPADDGGEFRRVHHLEEKFVVMYAGAHGMSNDLDVVLESASLLAGLPEIQIVLVGDGKEKSALQAQAENLNLKNMTFLPPVPKGEMAKTLAGAHACIAILKPLEEYKTTYPNKVFDYMAAARPVILAIDGVIRDVVEKAECGMFSRPGDSEQLAETIRYFYNNRERAGKMGMAGRAYLEKNFSRAAIMEKLVKLLENMK
ncbi:MAG: glycosyltransferase family 4 protein [Chloroflexi bacterium]|nr:glycosyltransferase family 4 protein [Chloroflexota bacterium]